MLGSLVSLRGERGVQVSRAIVLSHILGPESLLSPSFYTAHGHKDFSMDSSGPSSTVCLFSVYYLWPNKN